VEYDVIVNFQSTQLLSKVKSIQTDRYPKPYTNSKLI